MAQHPEPHVVGIVETGPTPTAVIAERTTWTRFPTQWGGMLDEVWALARRDGLAAGHNVMVFRDDPPGVDVEVGVEVDGPFVPSGRAVASSLPAGRAARTVARGEPSPETLGAAHDAVHAWCEAHDHRLTGCRWEVYGHSLPDQDPAAFETEVYWLLG